MIEAQWRRGCYLYLEPEAISENCSFSKHNSRKLAADRFDSAGDVPSMSFVCV